MYHYTSGRNDNKMMRVPITLPNDEVVDMPCRNVVTGHRLTTRDVSLYLSHRACTHARETVQVRDPYIPEGTYKSCEISQNLESIRNAEALLLSLRQQRSRLLSSLGDGHIGQSQSQAKVVTTTAQSTTQLQPSTQSRTSSPTIVNPFFCEKSFLKDALQIENKRRLSAETQALYRTAEESEDESWMEVTDRLQRDILREKGVDELEMED